MATTTAIDPNKLPDPLGVGGNVSASSTNVQTLGAPAPAPAPTGMIGAPAPASPYGVNFATDTVEGRVGNLLQSDSSGTMTNPLVRQAVDRQNQVFNGKGLLNSSMAAQAGQEAAISKALDIAAPDAQTYAAAGEATRGRAFTGEQAGLDRTQQSTEAQRARDFEGGQNQLQRDFTAGQNALDRTQTLDLKQGEQDFTLRSDYRKSLDNLNANYQKMLDTINSSSMTPADKDAAVRQAQAARDGETAFLNNVYTAQPRWQSEWLAQAVPTGTVNIATITNTDTLANIVNDPAQPAAVRAQAQARLAALGIGPGATGTPPAPPPAPGAPPPPAPGPSGSNIPDLNSVNLLDALVKQTLMAQGIWDSPEVQAAYQRQLAAAGGGGTPAPAPGAPAPAPGAPAPSPAPSDSPAPPAPAPGPAQGTPEWYEQQGQDPLARATLIAQGILDASGHYIGGASAPAPAAPSPSPSPAPEPAAAPPPTGMVTAPPPRTAPTGATAPTPGGLPTPGGSTPYAPDLGAGGYPGAPPPATVPVGAPPASETSGGYTAPNGLPLTYTGNGEGGGYTDSNGQQWIPTGNGEGTTWTPAGPPPAPAPAPGTPAYYEQLGASDPLARQTLIAQGILNASGKYVGGAAPAPAPAPAAPAPAPAPAPGMVTTPAPSPAPAPAPTAIPGVPVTLVQSGEGSYWVDAYGTPVVVTDYGSGG